MLVPNTKTRVPSKDGECRSTRKVWQWKKGNTEWISGKEICPSPVGEYNDANLVLIAASANNMRCCQICRNAMTHSFGIPDIWWEDYCKEVNGYVGYQTLFDEDGKVIGKSSWARFLIKVLDEWAQYHWYKLNTFSKWISEKQQMIVILFDAPPDLADKLPSPLLENPSPSDLGDPFWIYVRLMKEVVRLQSDSVWSLRTHLRTSEKTRIDGGPPKPDDVFIHELSRHAIHMSETLDLATQSIQSLLSEHKFFMETDMAPASNPASRNIHERLLFFGNVLESLSCRAASNKERLRNEVQFAMNRISQYDAGVSLQIGRAARADSATMRTIAYLTLVFLPGTFICALFSTSFFSTDPDQGWKMSEKFWVYWAFALPLTILTCTLWYFWQKKFDQNTPNVLSEYIDLKVKEGDSNLSKRFY